MYRKLILVLLITAFLAGCWDQQDITKRTIVLCLGLDRVADGRTKVSLQIPIGEQQPTISGTTVEAKPFILLSAEGKSAFAAIPALQSKTQRDLFFGQIKTVIINADLARRGSRGMVDFLRRHPTIPPQAFFLLTEQEASKILSYPLVTKQIPMYFTVGFFQSQGKKDWAFSQRVWEFDRNIDSQTQDAYIPLIDYNHREKIFVIKGLGVFHDSKLVGKLSGMETRMFGLLSGLAKNGYLSNPIPKYGRITFRKVTAKPKVKVAYYQKQFYFKISVKVHAYLVEATAGEISLTPREQKQIQTITAHYLNREMKKTIRHLQELNSDILALGEKLRATHPKEWAATDWDQEYPKAKISVSVKFMITRTGTKL
ncbi:MAG TPA: Ger(x)C family spore germination protein [Bacillota bacterium]|nr:Ger(x)C family spore germination protein [Bacillota bacterium]